MEERAAEDAAAAWDALKLGIRKETLALIRQRRRAHRGTLNQRLHRFFKQEARIKQQEAWVPASVDTLTELFDTLTLADGKWLTSLQRVRSAITDCIRAKLTMRTGRLYHEGVHARGKTSKRLFRRVSTKYMIHKLDAASGEPSRGVHEKVDTLADAWSPIFQQKGSTTERRVEALSWLGVEGQYKEVLGCLTSPITEAEAAAAIGGSQTGKACGPDRLGNDWYRDFSVFLIPILAKLFNIWTTAGIFPHSFMEADIFCLTKGGAAQDPLNYRPLALLDSDYKTLTSVIATRTSAKLHWMSHPNQNGFIPFRVIHDTLDLFHAAQEMAAPDPTLAAALALLLDFRKAYDSVDREFMYAVLLWLGFPEQYVKTMRGLYDGTKFRFLANGCRSRWVSVTCGIRQGCALAPLLFILPLEALYRKIDRETQIAGIVLRIKAGHITLKVAGYADDTACYVRSVGEVTTIRIIAKQFAAASGLTLNEGKTLIIGLNPDMVDMLPQLPAPLAIQSADRLARYLGIQVGSKTSTDYKWSLARSQLTARLALTMHKTSTVDQRCTLANAIILPKLLNIGRHCWPTAPVVALFQRMIKHFVWHARFTTDRMDNRAWLNQTGVQLPRVQGGAGGP